MKSSQTPRLTGAALGSFGYLPVLQAGSATLLTRFEGPTDHVRTAWG